MEMVQWREHRGDAGKEASPAGCGGGDGMQGCSAQGQAWPSLAAEGGWTAMVRGTGGVGWGESSRALSPVASFSL